MRNKGYRRTGLAKLGSVLRGTLDSIGLGQKVAQQQAAQKWREVVGPQIAAVSVVERVSEDIMFVSCKNSLWASELTLHAKDILGKLQKQMGERVITEIRFSARGFTKQRDKRIAVDDDEPYTARAELSEKERRDATTVASAADSQELGSRIEKAVLAGKIRQKAMRDQPGGQKPGGAPVDSK